MLPGLNPADDAADRGPARTQSLYRAYRPQTFADDELVGQEHVSRTLRNAIARDRVAHAYLFCGPRGTGKTTTARLLAKAVNCLDPDPAARPCNACDACRAINENRATDVIEIDAASHRGIDDIRELREQTRYAPAQLKTKFYIIDEAHRLTKEAFDAFLKTLEEPPPNTVFVLATTEAERLPATIASRCQRFDFHRIPAEPAAARVRAVCRQEGIEIDDEALALVVRQSTGSLRDALSLIDLLATAAGERGAATIDGELARRMLGLSHDDRAVALLDALAERDVAAGLAAIADAVEAGLDMRTFGRQIVGLLRTLLLTRAGANPPETDDEARRLAERFELTDLLRINQHFSEVDTAIRVGSFPQLPLELALVAAIVEPPASAAPNAVAEPREGSSYRPRPVPAAPEPFERPRGRAPERPRAVLDAPTGEAPRRRSAAPPTPIRGGDGDAFQQVVAAWERIRTEVKTSDVKVAALLRETDPAACDGRQLVLAAAYPFHAKMLNDAKARGLIEEAVARVLHLDVVVSAALRDELPAQPARANGAARPTSTPAPVPAPAAAPADDDLLRTAKALFDAEEVDPDDYFPPE